jgi:hypothetical protein
VALEAARGIEDKELRSEAVCHVSDVVCNTDPGRALEIARGIEDDYCRFDALTDVAEAVAKTDLQRALAIAATIENERWRAGALVGIAESLADTAPDQALEVARSIGDEEYRAGALATIAEAMAKTDTKRALDVARTISDPDYRVEALARSAVALEGTNPERAKDIAEEALEAAKSTGKGEHPYDLYRIVTVFARADQQRAVEIARTIQNEDARAEATVALAKVGSPAALDLAHSIGNYFERRDTVAKVARALATVDLDLALEAARSITCEQWQMFSKVPMPPGPRPQSPFCTQEKGTLCLKCEDGYRMTMLDIVGELAEADPDRALEVADESGDDWVATAARSRVVWVLAWKDPDRAADIARYIEDKFDRAVGLGEIAEAILERQGKEGASGDP